MAARKKTERLKPDPISRAVRATIKEMGYPLDDPHLSGSPDRIARFMREWHQQGKLPPKLTMFPNNPRVDELVVVSGIPFYSLCAHHGVPFFGSAIIGYIPSVRVLGLSKFARVVDYYANRFQTQERLTQEVASNLFELLHPRGMGVIMEAEHLCMSMRGIKKPGHCTTTSALFGACKDDPATRAEFFSIARRP